MVNGTLPPLNEEDEIRSELLGLIRDTEVLAGRVTELHGRLAIPARDDLMLLGEEEPVFLHVVRVVLECAGGDYLEPLLRDLRKVLAEEPAS